MSENGQLVHLTILRKIALMNSQKVIKRTEYIVRFYIFLLMNKENFRPQSGVLGRKTHQMPKKSLKPSNSSSQLTNNSRQEYHDHYVRFLIATNAQYFHSKLHATLKGRPKDLKFKIPCRTGMTVYKKDFKQKEAKYNKQEDLKHNISTIDCIKTNNFLKDDSKDVRINDKTMYQKEFRYHPIKTESCKRPKRRLDTSHLDDEKAPRFLDTQNKIDFLNWAGKSYVPSMKPQEKSVATNLPFEATSIYKSDFDPKVTTQTPIFVRESSYPNFGCVSMIMKSNYSTEFSEKKGGGCEINCKPKHFDANLCKLFKGTTEYKREFIQSRKLDSQENDQGCRTLEDMQTLIIDL